MKSPNDDLDDDNEARPRRRVAGITVYVMAALLVTAIVWSAWAQIDERVITRGRLVNPSPHIVVRPLEDAVLQAVLVRPGQVVRRGDVLARLDASFAGADLSQLTVRESSLRAQAERLRREAGAAGAAEGAAALARQPDQQALLIERQAATAARLRQFDENIARLQASIETNRRDQDIVAQRVRSLADLETMLQPLVQQNYASRSRLLEAQEKRLEAERDLTQARHREAEIRREIRGAEAERVSYLSASRQKVREELTQTQREGDELREQLTKAKRRADLVTLVAPQDAVVLDLRQSALGSVVRREDVLATLVPLGETLQAEIELATADVAEVRSGDAVRIKLDAYPFQKHGVLAGRVESIGGDAVQPAPNGSPAQVPSYVGRVALTSTRLEHTPRPVQLLPGMSLTAEVVVGRRTVLSYFLYPVIRTLDEAAHEP